MDNPTKSPVSDFGVRFVIGIAILSWASFTQASMKTITISGQVGYKPLHIDAKIPFVSGTFKGVPEARFEIWDIDNGFGEEADTTFDVISDLLASGFTDDKGNFSKNIIFDDSFNGPDIRIKIYLEGRLDNVSDISDVMVENLVVPPSAPVSSTFQTAIFLSNIHSDVASSINLSITNLSLSRDGNFSEINKVANGFSEIHHTAKWVKERTGAALAPRSRIVVHTWEESGDGTANHGDGGDDIIRLSSNSRYLNFIVSHEYAHAILWELYSSNPPKSLTSKLKNLLAGGHTAFSERSLQSAFNEGWASFLSNAVHNDPAYYLFSDGVTGGSADNMERNDWWKGSKSKFLIFGEVRDNDGTNNSGEGVEGAIASVLYDMMDGEPVSGTCIPHRPFPFVAGTSPQKNPNCLDGQDNDLTDIGSGMAVEFNRVFQVLRTDQPKTMREFYEKMLKKLNGETKTHGGIAGALNEKRIFGDVCQLGGGMNFSGVDPLWDSDGDVANVGWKLLRGKSGIGAGPAAPPPPAGLPVPPPQKHWPVVGQNTLFKIRAMKKSMLQKMVSDPVKIEEAWIQILTEPLEVPLVTVQNDGSGDAAHIPFIWRWLSDRTGRLEASSWQPQLNTISPADKPVSLDKLNEKVKLAPGQLQNPREPFQLRMKEGLYVGRAQGFQEKTDAGGGVARTDYHTVFGDGTTFAEKKKTVDFWTKRNAVFRFKLDLTPTEIKVDITGNTVVLTFALPGGGVTQIEKVISKAYKVNPLRDTMSHIVFVQKITGNFDLNKGICDTVAEAVNKVEMEWTGSLFKNDNVPKTITIPPPPGSPPGTPPTTITIPAAIPEGIVTEGRYVGYRVWDLAGHEAGFEITVDPPIFLSGNALEYALICPDPGFVMSSGFGEKTSEPYRGNHDGKDLLAHLSVPVSNNRVKANVPVVGLATGKNFHSYRLEYGKGRKPDTWVLIKESRWGQEEDVIPEILVSASKDLKGNLGVWHTGLTEYAYPLDPWARDMGIEGLQTLRLVVSDTWGNSVEDSVTVVVGTVLGNDFKSEVRSEDGRARMKAPGMSLRGGFEVAALLAMEDEQVPVYGGMERIGKAYQVMPYALRFIQPVEMRMSYEGYKGDEEKLGVYRYNGAYWERVQAKRDGKKKELAVRETSYSGYYAIFAGPPPEGLSVGYRVGDEKMPVKNGDEFIDALVFTNNDGKIPTDAMKDAQKLIAAGQWKGSYDLQTDQRSSINIGLYRRPIVRKKETLGKYIDTNSKDDWEAKR